MTFDERVREVAEFGFSERQGGFLVNVMLHSGVFVRRQYCAWAGVTHGEKVHQFIKRLDSRRMATPQRCGHGRGRLYHLHFKPLYDAIGERDNRLRRPAQLGRAVERLMLLDAVLADRSVTWLATEREKVSHFVSGAEYRRTTSRLRRSAHPHPPPFGTSQRGCRSGWPPTASAMCSCTWRRGAGRIGFASSSSGMPNSFGRSRRGRCASSSLAT